MLLQRASGIAKSESYFKVRRNTDRKTHMRPPNQDMREWGGGGTKINTEIIGIMAFIEQTMQTLSVYNKKLNL